MSQKKATIVNLAASNVSVSQFSVQAGSLVLEEFFVEEITPGLTGDDEWLNAAIAALASLVNAHDLKGRVTVIAPSFLLLQKPLKVPQVERARQAQIVAFEAQNAIPYPLNEVIWDSQLMASDGVEAEVLLFALRTEIATKIANMVTSTGLRPMSIQAAPLLDSQAFRLAGGSAAEEVLIVNVGARSTTLSFVGPSGVNIQSATNIGGNLLTQGVSDNTGQPVINAESLKVGFFTHVIQLPESDPQFAILEANKQSFNRRLSQDINRRLISIKRLGRRPTKIVITGRSSQVPGLSQQLSEALALPVEEFNPLGVISLSSDISADYVMQHLHQLSEVVGEASRLLSPAALGVNLIPRDIAGQISFESQKIKFVFAALLLAIAPVPILLTLNNGADYNKEQTKTLKKKSDELISYQNTIKQNREESLVVLAVNQQLEFVVSNSPNWPIFLADLQSRVLTAKNTWIEELRVRRESAVVATSTEPDASRVATNVTRVTITTRTLLEKVPPGKSLKAEEFNKRKAALVESLKKSPFVAEIPEDEIKVDFTKEANIPRTTLTLVIKSDQAL
jgi:type IV pilus assembly protein PilM